MQISDVRFWFKISPILINNNSKCIRSFTRRTIHYTNNNNNRLCILLYLYFIFLFRNKYVQIKIQKRLVVVGTTLINTFVTIDTIRLTSTQIHTYSRSMELKTDLTRIVMMMFEWIRWWWRVDHQKSKTWYKSKIFDKYTAQLRRHRCRIYFIWIWTNMTFVFFWGLYG